jgi:hypothetical protein
MCLNRDCGECRILTQANARRANRGASWFVLFVVLVLIFGHLAGFIEGVLVTLACAGALALGIAAGYVYVRFVLPARRQRAAEVLAPSRIGAAISRSARAGREVEPASRPGELPEGGQHLHIHLPPGASADDVARLMRGGR